MAPAREGSFNANFAPATLSAFKEHCKQSGKQYTKVLERLAEMYLESDGAIVSAPEAPAGSTGVPASSSIRNRKDTLSEVLERLDRLEGDSQEFASAFEMLVHRVEALEKED